MEINRTYSTALRGGKQLYKTEQAWFKRQARREIESGYAIIGAILIFGSCALVFWIFGVAFSWATKGGF